ncbi:Permease of the drug/metabolite transporter (DMT) superfamily [hydrothermal vent metagenome]|uniref:Permease of the drug/metabolite transporter (DMT) superfamily n=1 Tax=hydrothermal vent metagenome TaxID=652676 RepID=A0A3B0TXG6_9ZZZZ
MTLEPSHPVPANASAGLVLGLIGVIIFGGTLPMMRIAVTELDVMFVTAGRAVAAGMAGMALLALARARLPARSDLATLAIIALTLVAGFPFFATLAMTYAPASHGGVVLGIMPLATAAAAVVLVGERPSVGFWVCAVVGAGVVLTASLRGVSEGFVLGDLALLGAIVSASIGYVLSGKLARTMPGWAVISWALIFSLPIAGPLAWWSFPDDPGAVTLTSWSAFAYLAIMSQFVGFFAWNKGLALGGIARVGQMQLLQTFVTLGLAAWLIGEVIDIETIGFAIAVVAIVGLGLRMRVRPGS